MKTSFLAFVTALSQPVVTAQRVLDQTSGKGRKERIVHPLLLHLIEPTGFIPRTYGYNHSRFSIINIKARRRTLQSNHIK